MTLRGSVEAFLRYLKAERHTSLLTIQAYRSDLAQFQVFLFTTRSTSVDVAEVDSYAIRQYMAWLVQQNKKPRTVVRRLAAIRSLYRFLLHEGVVPLNPGQDVKPPKLYTPVSKVISQVQATALVESPQGQTEEVLRDRAILETLYSTGARISELAVLNWADVRWDEGSVVLHGPRNKERLTPIGQSALDSLAVYRQCVIQTRGKELEALFLNRYGRRLSVQSVASLISKYSQRISGVKVTGRDLRRAFATHLLEKGANAADVLAMLGTASLSHPEESQQCSNGEIETLLRSYLHTHPRAKEK